VVTFSDQVHSHLVRALLTSRNFPKLPTFEKSRHILSSSYLAHNKVKGRRPFRLAALS